jgi:hypothetical protein
MDCNLGTKIQEQSILALIDLAISNKSQNFSDDLVNGIAKASLLFQAARTSKASFVYNTICSKKSEFASTAATIKALSRSKCRRPFVYTLHALTNEMFLSDAFSAM